MKIVFFLAHPFGLGGAQKQMIIQAKAMSDLGNSVKVFIQDDYNGQHGSEQEELLKHYNLDYKSITYSTAVCMESIDVIKVLNDYNRIYNLIYSSEPDIIHSCQLNPTVELVSRGLNIPHVMSVYPIENGTFNIKWVDIISQEHICDSEFYCSKWREGMGCNSRCIRVIYEENRIGSHISKKRETNRPIGIINIGKFGEYKQQLLIIKLVEKCHKKGINITVNFLGEYKSPYGDECRMYVKEHRLSELVSFIGHVENVEDYFARADLMIHSSRMESYPGVIAEAMANHVPVLAMPAGGISELIEDGVNGFLTKGFDMESLSEAFSTYLEYRKNNKIQLVVKNAFKTYLSNHTVKKNSHLLFDVYERITKEYDNDGRLLLDDIQAIFGDFCKTIRADTINSITRDNIWYLFHIKQVLGEQKEIMIWGAGNWGDVAIEWCRILDCRIEGYIDMNASGYKNGYPIYKPSINTIKNSSIILVAIYSLYDIEIIMGILENAGKTRNKNYFLMNNDPCLRARYIS